MQHFIIVIIILVPCLAIAYYFVKRQTKNMEKYETSVASILPTPSTPVPTPTENQLIKSLIDKLTSLQQIYINNYVNPNIEVENRIRLLIKRLNKADNDLVEIYGPLKSKEIVFY